MLHAKHTEYVDQHVRDQRKQLSAAGVSYIIPVRVGNPTLCSPLSDRLIQQDLEESSAVELLPHNFRLRGDKHYLCNSTIPLLTTIMITLSTYIYITWVSTIFNQLLFFHGPADFLIQSYSTIVSSPASCCSISAPWPQRLTQCTILPVI